jgi:hypothetical protein
MSATTDVMAGRLVAFHSMYFTMTKPPSESPIRVGAVQICKNSGTQVVGEVRQ